MAHKRTKACAIPQKVKKTVYERDRGLCIFCGRPGDPVAHVISRAHGGLGVERNIVTACTQCHERMDNSTDRQMYISKARSYLEDIYGPIDWAALVYRKGTK